MIGQGEEGEMGLVPSRSRWEKKMRARHRFVRLPGSNVKYVYCCMHRIGESFKNLIFTLRLIKLRYHLKLFRHYIYIWSA